MLATILFLILPFFLLLWVYCLERDNHPEGGKANPRAK